MSGPAAKRAVITKLGRRVARAGICLPSTFRLRIASCLGPFSGIRPRSVSHPRRGACAAAAAGITSKVSRLAPDRGNGLLPGSAQDADVGVDGNARKSKFKMTRHIGELTNEDAGVLARSTRR